MHVGSEEKTAARPPEKACNRPRSRLRVFVSALRPRQWIKNLFVIAPLVFAKKLLDPGQGLVAAFAFLLFCTASGVVYILNDLLDREADRLHPTKRLRPIASGELPHVQAGWMAAGLAVLSLCGSILLGVTFTFCLLSYLLLNVIYSVALKRIPYLDVTAIAGGFLLRVMAGASALKVEASVWLLVCTGLLSVYLGLGKRAHELVALKENAADHRSVLKKYRLGHLRLAMVLLAVATVAAYVFYTLSPHTRAFFGTRRLVWTSFLPLLGLIRFGQLVLKHHRAESPTEEMLKDGPFLGISILWGISVVLLIYLFPS